jgi:uncharacterized repeat protein (TIGR01451 family)
MEKKSLAMRPFRQTWIWLSVLVTAVVMLLFVQGIRASSAGSSAVRQDDSGEVVITGDDDGPTLTETIKTLPFVITEANISASTKSVNESDAVAGEMLQYTILISNTGDQSAENVQLSDVLPESLMLVGDVEYDTLSVWNDSFGAMNGVITWTGSVGPAGYSQLTFDVVVSEDVEPGTVITNTAVITGTGISFVRSATTAIVAVSTDHIVYLPVIYYAIPTPQLNVSTPTPQNQWNVYWDDVGPGVTRYVLQESQTSNFAQVTEYVITNFTPGGVVSKAISHPPSVSNVYYYRVQAQNNDSPVVWSGWSNVGVVTGTPVNLNLQTTRPNANNRWTLSWQNPGTSVTGYELQEAAQPNFSNATTINLSTVTSYSIQKPLSTTPVFYYRIRPKLGDVRGVWSNSVMVIGGYRDDFSDPTSGWVPQRRTTYLEQTNALYGQNSEEGNLIIIVGDRWDWMIASPLVPAPKVPYDIEFRARVHDASNLISGGALFGGDWNGDPCPEYGNIYQTDNCFNHFYNFNMIFYGPMKLLHEQVDEVVWCPTCGGSPLKRLGPTIGVDPILPNGPSLDWNVYRIEVRANGVRYYVNGNYAANFTDTTWINEPYFGVFASTDEYKPSIWFFDYYQVRPAN